MIPVFSLDGKFKKDHAELKEKIAKLEAEVAKMEVRVAQYDKLLEQLACQRTTRNEKLSLIEDFILQLDDDTETLTSQTTTRNNDKSAQAVLPFTLPVTPHANT